MVTKIIGIKSTAKFTSTYESQQPDWRTIINPKYKVEIDSIEVPKYIQVFEGKQKFIPNLSILDLLFNLGPESKLYLTQLNQSIKYGSKN